MQKGDIKMENYNELYEKLSHIEWLMGRRHLRNHKEYGPYADPTRGQGRVLTLLKMQPEISTRELSYLLGIRQQSLNELLNKLERAGYVLREPSEADRRVMLVKLTEKGKTQQQEMEYTDIFSCLSPEEQSALGDYLDRITTALEEQLDDKEEEKMNACIRPGCDRMEDERFATASGKLHGWGYRTHGEPFPGSHGGHGGCGEHKGHGRHGKNGEQGCPGPEGRGGHPYGHREKENRNREKREDQ